MTYGTVGKEAWQVETALVEVPSHNNLLRDEHCTEKLELEPFLQ